MSLRTLPAAEKKRPKTLDTAQKHCGMTVGETLDTAQKHCGMTKAVGELPACAERTEANVLSGNSRLSTERSDSTGW